MSIVEKIIPKDTIIYKGFHSSHIKNLTNINDMLGSNEKGYFFTDIQKDAEKYGSVFVFITTQELRLIHMPYSVKILFDDKRTPKKVKDALKQYFMATCKHRNESKYRNSVSSEKDRIVANYCCKLGYDGYYTGKGEMQVLPINEIDEPSCAESEMYICNPIVGSKIMFIHKVEDPKRIASPPKVNKKSRKKSRIETPEQLPPPHMPLQNLHFTPPQKIPRRNLFGDFGGYKKTPTKGGYIIRPSQRTSFSKKSKRSQRKTSRKLFGKNSRKSQRKTRKITPSISYL